LQNATQCSRAANSERSIARCGMGLAIGVPAPCTVIALRARMVALPSAAASGAARPGQRFLGARRVRFWFGLQGGQRRRKAGSVGKGSKVTVCCIPASPSPVPPLLWTRWGGVGHWREGGRTRRNRQRSTKGQGGRGGRQHTQHTHTHKHGAEGQTSCTPRSPCSGIRQCPPVHTSRPSQWAVRRHHPGMSLSESLPAPRNQRTRTLTHCLVALLHSFLVLLPLSIVHPSSP
jgi:hypothetical protein